jgi:hypothetical protein
MTEFASIKLSDGTTLKIKITVVDIKEGDFSPFGDISFDVKAVGGVTTDHVPEELKKAMSDKPISLDIMSLRGWEIIDIIEKECAAIEETVNSSKGKFIVRVEAEPIMSARNMNYRSVRNEPIYYVSWVWKISWKPVKETG